MTDGLGRAAPPADDDAIVDLFSATARRQVEDDLASGPSPVAWHQLAARRAAERQRAKPRRHLWLWATVVAGTAAVALGIGWRRPARPVTYAVADPTLEQNGYVRGVGGSGTEIRFSDGTRARVADGGRLSVLGRGPRGARLRVEEGRVRFEVVPRPRAEWVVEAGPFAVDVTGTVFDVRWSAADEVAQVHLREGSVRVRGPLIGAPVRLRAGQQLSARLARGEIQVSDGDDARPAPPSATPPVDERAPSDETRPPPGDVSRPLAPARAAGPGRRVRTNRALRGEPQVDGEAASSGPAFAPERWPARLASGDAAGVVAEAEGWGIDRTLDQADDRSLAALADAARYTGRPELATTALLTARRRFPGTPAARSSAFLLGRLAEDRQQPDEALGWYERYLSEAPRGPYASEALGRKMLAVERTSGRDGARSIAAEYIRRFPDGTYLLQARSILASP